MTNFSKHFFALAIHTPRAHHNWWLYLCADNRRRFEWIRCCCCCFFGHVLTRIFFILSELSESVVFSLAEHLFRFILFDLRLFLAWFFCLFLFLFLCALFQQSKWYDEWRLWQKLNTIKEKAEKRQNQKVNRV